MKKILFLTLILTATIACDGVISDYADDTPIIPANASQVTFQNVTNNVGTTDAEISYVTDVPSDCTIYYGIGDDRLKYAEKEMTPYHQIFHKVVLDSLESGAEYKYFIRAVPDRGGYDETETPAQTFQTGEKKDIGVVRSNVTIGINKYATGCANSDVATNACMSYHYRYKLDYIDYDIETVNNANCKLDIDFKLHYSWLNIYTLQWINESLSNLVKSRNGTDTLHMGKIFYEDDATEHILLAEHISSIKSTRNGNAIIDALFNNSIINNDLILINNSVLKADIILRPADDKKYNTTILYDININCKTRVTNNL